MITADDVAKVVFAQLSAVSGYATTLPGKAWFDRGPDSPDGYPYSVFKVDGNRKELTSGNKYVDVWTIRLAAYAPIGAAGVDPQAVQLLFASALVTTAANTALRAVAMRNASEKVLAGRPSSVKGSFDSKLREGRDVFVCGAVVELVVQGDGSVA